MATPDFSHLGPVHDLDDDAVPELVREIAGGRLRELVWRNELGGLTFRVGADYLKWNPLSTGIDLGRERTRLDWLSRRHPAPRVLDFGATVEAQWLLTAGIHGDHAVGDAWRARRSEAITAIAMGLRAIHALATDEFPPTWTAESWAGRTPDQLGARPPIEDAVLVHGDACAPNTLISAAGAWVGHVDVGDLCLGDRWADLAIASMSLDWNFGEGHQEEFFAAYGIAPDAARIAYYRALWELES